MTDDKMSDSISETKRTKTLKFRKRERESGVTKKHNLCIVPTYIPHQDMGTNQATKKTH